MGANEGLRSRKVIALVLLLSVLLSGLLVLPRMAFAESEEAAATTEKADDQTGAEKDSSAAKMSDGLPEDAVVMGNDVVWFGRSGDFAGLKVINDILAMGETINISGTKVGGSLRLSGRIITISECTVGQNITAAGQDVSVTDGSSKVVALAGQTIVFSGEATELKLAGSDVTIDGVVSGDVKVAAGTLTIGPNAQINGTLTGEVGQKPTIDEAATVAENEVIVSAKEEPKSFRERIELPYIAISAAVCVAIALLVEWLAGGLTEGAADLLSDRPGSFILSGVLGTILAPICALLICIPVVTIPVGMAILLMLLAIALVSSGFTSAMLAHLAMPNMNRYLSAGLVALVLGVLMAMPYVGIPLRGIASMFALGYFICAMRKGMKDRKEEKNFENKGARFA